MARSFTRDVTIARLGGGGDGIVDTPEGRIYVPFALPGEIAGIRLGPEIDGRRAGELLELHTISPDRVEPPCPHFQLCGGCRTQHIAPPIYKDWKRGLLISALKRRGLETEVTELLSTPLASRRRVDLQARQVGGNLLLGFHETNSRRIIDLQVCPIMQDEILRLIPSLRETLQSILPPGPGLDIKIAWLDNGADILLTGPLPITMARRGALLDFAAAIDVTRLSHQEQSSQEPEIIIQRRVPAIAFDGVPVTPPPGAFLQASSATEKAMQTEIAILVKGAERIADLFAGVGTFSLPLSRNAHVLAVEADRAAIGALQKAANHAQRSVQTERRDLVRQPLDAKELKRFDVALFDPPRSGAKEQAVAFAGSSVPRIIAISCAPNTFSRDAKILIDGGYRLEKAIPIDQFLWSSHLEVIGYFVRA